MMKQSITTSYNNENIEKYSKTAALSAVTCDLCSTLVTSLQDLSESGKNADEIIKFAIDFCTLFHIEKKNVCEGIIPLFRNETFEIVANKTYSPVYICGFVGICPFNPANYSGTIVFPTPKPPHVPPVPPAKGGPTKTILHLSDFHIDQFYQEGMNADCGQPVCCRAADGPGSGSNAAGAWGDYRCDVNLPMVHSMLSNIASQVTPDYIFWTGDNPPHDVWMQTHETQLNASALITDLLDKYFPGVQVYPAIGNHEGVPVNSFPLPDTGGANWLYSQLEKDWSNWLLSSGVDTSTISLGGYYSAEMMPGTRLVSLNMNWCNNQNLWMIQNITDPAGMLEWLIETMESIEAAKERAYIIGHIPTGISDCIDIWAQQLYQIVDRYEDSIIALFFGHTHHDQFQVYHDKTDGHPMAVSYIAPSVTTYTNQNPSYRIYTIDQDSGYILESSTYHGDVADANTKGFPTWKLTYNATTAYNMTNMFAADWQSVLDNMNTNTQVFNQYYNFFYAQSPYASSNPCTSKSCIDYYTCEAASGYYAQYKQCVANKSNGDLEQLTKTQNFVKSLPKALSSFTTLTKNFNQHSTYKHIRKNNKLY
ncbi:saposin B domain-containing protein [Heterostelium album PN500]|uniref:Sphingomyelin phosphodiesterase n=1 Tax=Heterostelium pallidum (strain ATCC 26659 / Pp 5 / PN500) TaxID=670386 RepID=D3BCI4_HETP5|nr:saposin B domain-containing protein [Heterostelium album PN500]EFA80626.1 saposin B domain-containing protein [Heterostelium album PN500]|eukprot:XP_020432746.1 saposin B domain-containing protein [Heterostelium album PN500]